MKALVYHGPAQRGWDTIDDPTIIDPTDIVVRIDSSTICGADLHILRETYPTAARHRAWARGRRNRAGDRSERDARWRSMTGCGRVLRELVRPLPLLQGGAGTDSAWVAAVGSSAT